MKCRADLRACLNCVQYDLRVSQQCRERRAEPVLEKAAGNFCEYFEFIRRDFVAPPKDAADDSREVKARDALKKLFGD